MKPMQVTFFLYAEDESEIQALSRDLHDMVASCYAKGVFVRARRVSEALKAFGNSSIVSNFFAR